MQCPACQTTKLAIADRQGIEIDYCPDCRGVWLDRGELDKIIERSMNEGQPGRGNDDSKPASPGASDHKHGKKRKKESLLGELFDF